MAPDSHHIKLIDFGLSRRYVPHQKLQVNFGTPEFVSPEVVNYNSVSYASDMWSVGVITYILVSGKYERNEFFEIKASRGSIVSRNRPNTNVITGLLRPFSVLGR